MMVVTKCPLRISFAGGSTDLESFIQRYGIGSVISFPSSLYVYISVHDNHRNKYIINYSMKEETDSIDQIKNDIAREVLRHFKSGPVTATFNSDIFSSGSGLATSSAYTIALVKAMSLYMNINMSDVEVCKLSLDIERKFNPLTGYQDPYGCGVASFKRMDFKSSKLPMFRYFEQSFLDENFDMYLVHTGIVRESTGILQSVDITKSHHLLELVDKLDDAITSSNAEQFLIEFNKAWETKKLTSPKITDSLNMSMWDNLLSLKTILGIKLCGAGGGGYFFVLTNKQSKDFPTFCNESNIQSIKVEVSKTGVIGQVI
jgi:D-glycero-alpha-D-manno-heptose-7-phosphate kinase